MTDQTKTALAAFKEHVLELLASYPAKRHSPVVAAIDIDRFLAAHRKEQAIKAGTWPEDAGEFGRLAIVAQNGNTGKHYSELGHPTGIPIEQENVDELKKWGMGLSNILEQCEFCRTGTRYWHTPTNTPVCPSCAKHHTVSELKAKLAKETT